MMWLLPGKSTRSRRTLVGRAAAAPQPLTSAQRAAAIPRRERPPPVRCPVVAIVGLGARRGARVGLLVYGVVHGGEDKSLESSPVRGGKRPQAPGLTMKRPLLNAAGEKSLADYKGQGRGPELLELVA